MPAKTTIFNAKATAVHSFALGPRNTLRFSPHGRFLVVGGFGNLAGQLDIYDLEKDYDKVASMQASNASICEWSTDGKHILTAVARLKVDNAIKIWHVAGGLMYNEDFPAGTELYQVAWRPEPATMHPLTDPINPAPVPHASALTYLSTVKTPSKPAGAYRPPGARGTTTPLAFMREDQGGVAFVRDETPSTISVNGFKPRRRDIPGAEPIDEKTTPGASGDGDGELSKAALKNKKKREAKKAKDAAEKAANLIPADGQQGERTQSPSRSPERRDRRSDQSRERGDRRDHQRNRSRNNSELHPQDHDRNRSQNRNRERGQSQGRDNRRGSRQDGRGKSPGPRNNTNQNGTVKNSNANEKRPANPQIDTAKAADLSAPDLTVTTPGGSTAQDKKIRALTKKLRAIDDLKMRRARGEQLEVTQLKKMETEESVKKELDGLGWGGD